MKIIETLALAFKALTTKQFDRLHATRGGPVLCGEDAHWYCRDGVG
jgi:hypothetical protein